MITPSSNTCLEPVTYQLVADTGITVHFARVPVTRIALDDEAASGFQAETMVAAARLLAAAGVDVIAWNGTSGSWLGLERDYEIVAKIEAATGVRATTSSLGILEACRVFGATGLGLVVPYTSDITKLIQDEYARHGLRCVSTQEAGLSDNRAFAKIPLSQTADQIRRAAVPEAHAVAVVCTNVHGAEVVVDLEAETKRPVFDSVAVTLWHALHILGGSRIAGHGRLLRAGSLTAELNDVARRLLEETSGDRVTVRLDLTSFHLDVDLPAAEAIRPGVRSIRHDASLDQRRLRTVQWLDERRMPLIQAHFRAAPEPPPELIEVYAVRAQMLGPVEGDDGQMTGWISVHSLEERPWSQSDQKALDDSMRDVRKILSHV